MVKDSVIVYHNPRCRKSREALQLLEARGEEPQVVEYLKTPPGRETLLHLAEIVDGGARAMLRDAEPEYKELGLREATLSDEALIDAIVAHPKLLQRPLVVRGDHAVIGRPPEKVLALLDQE